MVSEQKNYVINGGFIFDNIEEARRIDNLIVNQFSNISIDKIKITDKKTYIPLDGKFTDSLFDDETNSYYSSTDLYLLSTIELNQFDLSFYVDILYYVNLVSDNNNYINIYYKISPDLYCVDSEQCDNFISIRCLNSYILDWQDLISSNDILDAEEYALLLNDTNAVIKKAIDIIENTKPYMDFVFTNK